MNKTVYKQCGLRRKTENGHEYHTAWIPAQFAVKGKIVDIGKNRAGESSNLSTDTQK